MKIRLIVLFAALFASFDGYTLDLTVFINKDTTTLHFQFISSCSFNSTEEFNMSNEIIQLELAEELNLTVNNTDSLDHTFTIDGILEFDNVISGGSSTTFNLVFEEEGTYRYYSESSYGQGIGASGIILVGYQNYPNYFWNLYDLEPELTHLTASNELEVFPLDYTPVLFTINGRVYPATIEDSQGYIEATLNDELIISIINSGHMDHVLHFHGFHVEILDSKLLPERVGWIKDSIPIKCGEATTVKLHANQIGVYPVHDHNLIAVTNAGFYPGGMITHINISE